MGKGSKTLPPRNPLATKAGGLGKAAPKPYRQALADLRDKARTIKQGAAKFSALAGSEVRGGTVALPVDPRTAARQALTGTASSERSREKARRKIDEAARRMAEEMRSAEAEAAAAAANAPAPAAATNRPSRRELGRYGDIKNRRPT